MTSPVVIGACSTLGFHAVNAMLKNIFTSLPRYRALGSARQGVLLNTAVSLVHATINSCVILHTLVYRHEELTTDMVYGKVTCAGFLFPFTIGYFVYDSLDMLRPGFLAQDKTIFLHHGVVIAGGSVSAYWGYVQPFAFMASMAEINSVFLHARKILSMMGLKTSMLFHLNWVCLITTFLWTRLYIHAKAIIYAAALIGTHNFEAACGVLGGVAIYLHSIRLLRALLRKDLPALLAMLRGTWKR